MQQYIAIIRGVNVGGHNRVNMQMLREALGSAGLKNVQTYIQSGNIVFLSGIQKRASLSTKISGILKTLFDVDVPVLVRSAEEWQSTVNKNPFLRETEDHTKLLVTFLSGMPALPDVQKVSLYTFPHDEFRVVGSDVYLFCKDGYGRTDITNTFFEKHLKLTSTTRNWKSVLALSEMLQ